MTPRRELSKRAVSAGTSTAAAFATANGGFVTTVNSLPPMGEAENRTGSDASGGEISVEPAVLDAS